MRGILFLIICLILSCQNSDKAIQPKSESFSRLSQAAQMEKFPFVELNTSLYYENARVSVTQIPRLEASIQNDHGWSYGGPDQIAGRMLCLAVHPNDTQKLWAGSASGGLWKSETGGIGLNAWQYVKTNYLVSSFSAIAIHPNNPNIILAGTGEIYHAEELWDGKNSRTLRGFPGIGILRSKDGGDSWQSVLNWENQFPKGVHKIVFCKNGPDTVYAATSEGLYKSVNSGENWIKVFDKKLVHGLVLNSNHSNKLIVSIGGIGAKDYGLYQSIDGGNRWKKIVLPDTSHYQGKIMLANQDKDPEKIFAVISDQFKTIRFVRTYNSFETYFHHTIPDISSYQGWYANGLVVNEQNPSKLLAGGVDLFLDEFGSGNRFERLYPNITKVHVDFHDIVKNPIEPDKVYFCTDGGIFRSDDFGKSFYSCNGGLGTTQFYAGDVDKSNSDKILGGLQDNHSVFRDSNGVWTKVGKGDGGYCYFHPTDRSVSYISSQFGNILRSDDGNKTWIELRKADLNSVFIGPFVMHPQKGDVLISGSKELNVSKDKGGNWNEISFGTGMEIVNSIQIDPHDLEKAYYSSFSLQAAISNVYSINLESNEIKNLGIQLPNRIISDIDIHPIKNQKILVAFSGYLTDHIYLSDDNGENWSNIDGNLPDIPIHCVLFHPANDNIIFAGNDFGLFVTFNKGKEWINLTDQKIDAVPVYDLKFSESKKQLSIFTHGMGYFSMNANFDIINSVQTSNYESKSIKTVFHKSQLLALGNDDEVGLFCSIQGGLQKLSIHQLNFNWDSYPSGIYYFQSKHHLLKCLITK